MEGRVFECDVNSHVPMGPTYNNSLYRVCALSGAQPGLTQVRGEDYLKAVYDFDVDQRAISIVAILLLWFLFTLINAIAVEKIEWTHGGFMRRLYKRGKAPKSNDDNYAAEMASRALAAAENMQPIELVFNLKFYNF